jgi:endonuclease YncB( thermonuclease family)
MVTGYADSVVAEGHQRLRDIEQDIKEVTAILAMAQSDEQYNKPTMDYYLAAKDRIVAIRAYLKAFSDYYDTNKKVLVEEGYFTNIIQSITLQLDTMDTNIIVPSITTDQVKSAMLKSTDPTGFERVVTVTKIDDGDTFLYVDDTGKEVTVRLAGCDAPEGGTDRGKISAKFLSDLILGKDVTLQIDKYQSVDTFGRVLAVVKFGDLNVNVHLVSSCMAAPLTKFGRHHYLDMDQLKNAAEFCVMGWPQEAMLHVFTKPERCMVWIDGKDTNQLTGRGELRVPVGRHRLTFAKIGFGALNVEVNLEFPKIYDFTYELQKIGSTDGLVRISSVANDVGVSSIVMIDDVPQGLSPLITTLPVDKVTKVGCVTSTRGPVYKDVTAKLGEIVEVELDFAN